MEIRNYRNCHFAWGFKSSKTSPSVLIKSIEPLVLCCVPWFVGKQLSLLIVGCIFWNLLLEANCWWSSCPPDRPIARPFIEVDHPQSEPMVHRTQQLEEPMVDCTQQPEEPLVDHERNALQLELVQDVWMLETERRVGHGHEHED